MSDGCKNGAEIGELYRQKAVRAVTAYMTDSAAEVCPQITIVPKYTEKYLL